MKLVRRRSIVEFEKWLDAEITEVHAELDALALEEQALILKRTSVAVRLQALHDVKAKLAIFPRAVADGPAPRAVDAKAQ